jgi:hypothetical protein
MPELIPTPAIKSAGSFASLLESLTGSSEKKTNGTWDDSALLDDVATISYEQALRSHRRVAQAAVASQNEPQSATVHPSSQLLPVIPEKKRKSASITIRLTELEESQLHERAAAAQLSVSAYLRSCIFEAESLRAQVKEALSQIRTVAPAEPSPQSQARPSSSWRTRLLPHWRGHASS